RVEKKDAVIDWTASAAQIERMTRAYDPWPVARTRLDGGEVLIWRAAVEHQDGSTDAPGAIVSVKPNLVVQCGIGQLRLVEVQAAGRRRIPADDFFRGKRIEPGARFGA